MKLTDLYKGKKIFWTGDEMLTYVPSKPKWLIKGLIAHGDQVIVTAPSKTGKSVLSMQLASNISNGTPFADEFTIDTPAKVLYIQAEMTMDEVNSRMKRMNKTIKINTNNIRWLYVPSLPFIDKEAAQDFITSIEEGFPGFVPNVFIFDPIYMLSGGRSLKDDDVVQSIVANLSVIRFKYDATIIINHHNRRDSKDQKSGAVIPGDYFGSFIFEAWPDVRFNCSKPNPNSQRMVVSCKADRSGDKAKNINLYLNDGEELFFDMDADPDAKNHTGTVMEFFALEGQLEGTLDQIVRYVGVNKTLTKGAIRLLLRDKKIKKDDKGVYRLYEKS